MIYMILDFFRRSKDAIDQALDFILKKIPFFQIGNFIEDLFMRVPYWGVKVIITVLFLTLGVTPFFLPKDYIFRGSEDRPLWKDLRYWTLAVALSEVIVYLYF